MKKRNDEVPDNLGGLGELLPAEVLKLVNELLEQQHRTDHPNNGSNVINVYAPGSQHVDTQINIGDVYSKPKKTPKDHNVSAKELFDADTPLSALFRENHHEELRKIIESWRPYLIDDDPTTDALALTRFEFDFDKIIATHIYIDIGRLLYNHALKDDNMNLLAKYLFQHSNLSNSQSTLYVQLRKYKKR